MKEKSIFEKLVVRHCKSDNRKKFQLLQKTAKTTAECESKVKLKDCIYINGYK